MLSLHLQRDDLSFCYVFEVISSAHKRSIGLDLCMFKISVINYDPGHSQLPTVTRLFPFLFLQVGYLYKDCNYHHQSKEASVLRLHPRYTQQTFIIMLA